MEVGCRAGEMQGEVGPCSHPAPARGLDAGRVAPPPASGGQDGALLPTSEWVGNSQWRNNAISMLQVDGHVPIEYDVIKSHIVI